MCYTNSATMLCNTPLSDYASLPSKSGLRLCIAVKASMLFWCATENITPSDLSLASKMQWVRQQTNLSFGVDHDALVGKRLNKQIKRFAKLAMDNTRLTAQWRGVHDAAEFLRQRGYKDGADEDDGGMAGIMERLSLADGDAVMSGVETETEPQTTPVRPRSVTNRSVATRQSATSRRSTNTNTARPALDSNVGPPKASQSGVSVRMPDIGFNPWTANGPSVAARANPLPRSGPTPGSGLRNSAWNPNRATPPSTSRRSVQAAPSTPTASTIVPLPPPFTAYIPAEDEAAKQLWTHLYRSAEGDWDGLDIEQIEFEKCLRLEELGSKIAIEAETRMKEMTLLGAGRL